MAKAKDDDIKESRSKIENMTKAQIKEYAERKHDIELSTSDLKQEMIDQFFEEIEEMEGVSEGKTGVKHDLIPLHEKLSQEEAEEVYEEYKVSTREMPKISINDPAIRDMDIEEGDVIEITRESPTAGQTKFYRSVVRE